MDLRQYVENIQQQLAVAAEAGGDDARELAVRLVATLDAALRLALQDVLAAAAEEITCELAPGSVELRLRGRNPEFVVTPAPFDAASEPDHDPPPCSRPEPAPGPAPRAGAEADEGAMSRINLRMPDHLKARIEQAAGQESLSLNTWLVRAATAALEGGELARWRESRAPQSAQRYTGWAR